MITTMSEPSEGLNRVRKWPVEDAIHRELERAAAINSHRRRNGAGGHWKSLLFIEWQTGELFTATG